MTGNDLCLLNDRTTLWLILSFPPTLPFEANHFQPTRLEHAATYGICVKIST
jgi:hypothetical protein